MLRVKASQFLDTFWGKGFEEREKWLRELAKVDLLFFDEIGRSSETKNAQDGFFGSLMLVTKLFFPRLLLLI